jgi:nucleotide-binding universal stress UspA family protein
MYDDILVPTDGGEQMDAVIEAAVDLATERDATLHALSVIDRGVFLTLDEGLTDAVDDELTANAERAVDHVAEAARAAGIDVETAISRGRPGDEINAHADEIDADLVVMGTRGVDGHERQMLGSVSQDVVGDSTRQTLVIPLGSD